MKFRAWLTLSNLQQDHQLHLSNMPSKAFHYKGMTEKILSFKKCNIQGKKVTKLYFLMFSSFHMNWNEKIPKTIFVKKKKKKSNSLMLEIFCCPDMALTFSTLDSIACFFPSLPKFPLDENKNDLVRRTCSSFFNSREDKTFKIWDIHRSPGRRRTLSRSRWRLHQDGGPACPLTDKCNYP